MLNFFYISNQSIAIKQKPVNTNWPINPTSNRKSITKQSIKYAISLSINQSNNQTVYQNQSSKYAHVDESINFQPTQNSGDLWIR